MLTTQQQEQFMRAAMREARDAQTVDEVPIGAVVVYDGKIIGRGHNMREHFQDVTFHAEMLAITEACQFLGSWRLEDCDLFVTLEPCMMCSGAIVNSRINNVYYAADDPKAGTVHSLYQLLSDDRFNHQVTVHRGLYAEECGQMLRAFFKAVRQKRKAAKRLSADD